MHGIKGNWMRIKRQRAKAVSRHTHIKRKTVPQHTYGGVGRRGGIAPNNSRPRHYLRVSQQRHAPAGFHLRGKDTLDTEATRKIPAPLPGTEPRSPGSIARSQTLYRLSYPAHQKQA
jgi:hypothetical protein